MDKLKKASAFKEGKKIIVFAVLLIILLGGAYMTSKMEKNNNGNKINLDLYVMSQCPYGSQAENMVAKAMDGFTDYINFNVEYIAEQTDNGFKSLHGQPEVDGDIYQLCVKKHAPDKYWQYLTCQNKNYRDLASTFESCAKENNIDYNTIKSCAESNEGKELLITSLNKVKEVKANASPTFYLNNKIYNGPRTALGLQRTFCKELDNKPNKCANLPQDKEFTAYLINDSRCQKNECDTTRLVQQLKNTFSKIKFENLDYNTDKGKDFFTKYNLTVLPAVLFSQEVKETENYSQVANYLTKADDLYNLAIGAVYDPTKEICDNNIDDTNNGKMDCDDEDCKNDMACRQEISGRLDLFVMSHCPYGTKALDAMNEVLKNFGNNIDFHINYIADKNSDGSFRSLHGQPEVDEDIRELCAVEYYPNDYMNYVWCRNKDIKGDWTSCATNYPKIKACFNDNEGKNLLSKNIKFANDLNIGASPTWLVNNKYIFSGIDAETVKTNFCKYNDVAGCKNTLKNQATDNNVPAGSCN